jgi:hypothetical protein
MKTPASCIAVALALGEISLTPGLVRAQDFREEGPFEIEKCQTIDKPGSYKLVRNLTAPANADCIVMPASFVTVNLAGFSISGSGFGSAITTGQSSSVLQGITVRNESITGFAVGVFLQTALGFKDDLSIVEGLRISAGPPGSSFGVTAQGIVRGDTAAGFTSGFGISATGVVTGNYATGNGTGIFAEGPGNTVIGNTAINNAGAGIAADCPSNVTNNTAVNNNPNLQLIGNGCNNTNNVAP